MRMGEIIVNGVIVIIFLALVGFIVLVKHESRCTETRIVQEVGGCNKDGRCGVKWTDGSFGSENYPTAGQTFCTRRSMEFSWRFW